MQGEIPPQQSLAGQACTIGLSVNPPSQPYFSHN